MEYNKDEKPEKGKILISEPFLQDFNFKRSIVLLCEHNEEGTVGFILNKPTQVKLSQLIEDFPDFNAPVYFGGPVPDKYAPVHTPGRRYNRRFNRNCRWLILGRELRSFKIINRVKPGITFRLQVFHRIFGLDAGTA